MTQSELNKITIAILLLGGSITTGYKTITTYHSVYDYEFYEHAPMPVMSDHGLTVDLDRIKKADKDATTKALTEATKTCATGICLTALLTLGARIAQKNQTTKSR